MRILILILVVFFPSSSEAQNWTCFNNTSTSNVPDCDVLYIRDVVSWAALEPTDDNFRFEAVNSALNSGKDVIMGVVVEYSEDGRWVNRAPGHVLAKGSQSYAGTTILDWNSEAVFNEFRELLQRLGQYVRNHRNAERFKGIDIRFAGDTGGEFFYHMAGVEWPQLLPSEPMMYRYADLFFDNFNHVISMINLALVPQYGCRVLDYTLDKGAAWRDDGAGGFYGSDSYDVKYQEVYQRCPKLRDAWRSQPFWGEPWGTGPKDWGGDKLVKARELAESHHMQSIWGVCTNDGGACDYLQNNMGAKLRIESVSNDLTVKIVNDGNAPPYPHLWDYVTVLELNGTRNECPTGNVSPTGAEYDFFDGQGNYRAWIEKDGQIVSNIVTGATSGQDSAVLEDRVAELENELDALRNDYRALLDRIVSLEGETHTHGDRSDSVNILAFSDPDKDADGIMGILWAHNELGGVVEELPKGGELEFVLSRANVNLTLYDGIESKHTREPIPALPDADVWIVDSPVYTAREINPPEIASIISMGYRNGEYYKSGFNLYSNWQGWQELLDSSAEIWHIPDNILHAGMRIPNSQLQDRCESSRCRSIMSAVAAVDGDHPVRYDVAQYYCVLERLNDSGDVCTWQTNRRPRIQNSGNNWQIRQDGSGTIETVVEIDFDRLWSGYYRALN